MWNCNGCLTDTISVQFITAGPASETKEHNEVVARGYKQNCNCISLFLWPLCLIISGLVYISVCLENNSKYLLKLKLNERCLHDMSVDLFCLRNCMQKKSNCMQTCTHADRPHILTRIWQMVIHVIFVRLPLCHLWDWHWCMKGIKLLKQCFTFLYYHSNFRLIYSTVHTYSTLIHFFKTVIFSVFTVALYLFLQTKVLAIFLIFLKDHKK